MLSECIRVSMPWASNLRFVDSCQEASAVGVYGGGGSELISNNAGIRIQAQVQRVRCFECISVERVDQSLTRISQQQWDRRYHKFTITESNSGCLTFLTGIRPRQSPVISRAYLQGDILRFFTLDKASKILKNENLIKHTAAPYLGALISEPLYCSLLYKLCLPSSSCTHITC